MWTRPGVRTVGQLLQVSGAQEEAQGLLGERLLKTPDASSMVFLLAVSLATLWWSLLRRSWRDEQALWFLSNCNSVNSVSFVKAQLPF